MKIEAPSSRGVPERRCPKVGLSSAYTPRCRNAESAIFRLSTNSGCFSPPALRRVIASSSACSSSHCPLPAFTCFAFMDSTSSASPDGTPALAAPVPTLLKLPTDLSAWRIRLFVTSVSSDYRCHGRQGALNHTGQQMV